MKTLKTAIRFLTEPFSVMIHNRDLLGQTLKREISQKYRGSYLGILWNFVQPMIMMLVYSFVFGVVFKAKWDMQASNSDTEFAVILFVGISVYSVFTEAIMIAPTLITANANYVKKVIYPLEILSMVGIGSSLVQLAFNVALILLSRIIVIKTMDFFVLLFPLVLLPLLMLTLGLSWLLSAIGVFLKDMRQIASIITLVFGYATPVFFPITAVPEKLRWVMEINPMTAIVNNARNVLVFGRDPDWGALFAVYVVSYIVMMAGFRFFKKVKPGFADAM